MKKKSLLIKILVLALTTGAFSQYNIVFKNGTPTYIFTSYDILNGPYKDLNTLLSTLPGINGLGDYSDRPQIRGSDFREMQVIMDGMILTDQITNAPFLNVPLGIIDTLEVIPGGFGAEYGNARSGIIKIKSKQGGEKLHFQANMRYSPAGLKHFGPMAYGKDSPIVIPFVEESAGAFTGNEVFEGWNSYANHTLQSDDPHYGKPYETFALYLWRHRSPNNLNKLYNIVNLGFVDADLNNVTNDDAFFEYGTTPDWQGEYNISGPVPFLPKAKFFFSGKQEVMEYGIQTSQDTYNDNYSFLKLCYDITPAMKLDMVYGSSYQKGTLGRNGYEITSPVPKNPFRKTTDVFAQLPKYIWSSHRLPIANTSQYNVGFNFSHKLTENTNYRIHFSQQLSEIRNETKWRNTAPTYNDEYPALTALGEGLIGDEEYITYWASDSPEYYGTWREWAKIKIGNYWYDEAPYGLGIRFWNDASGFYRMASNSIDRNKSSSRTYNFKALLNTMLNKKHYITFGFDVFHDRVYGAYDRIKASVGGGNIYSAKAKPWRGTVFFSDKMQYSGLFFDFGVRIEWLKRDLMFFLEDNATDDINGTYSVYLTGTNYYPDKNLYPKKKLGLFYIEPRFSIQKQIYKHILYLNCGYYHQLPTTEQTYLYIRNWRRGLGIDYLGNPQLEAPKTVLAELGSALNFTTSLTINLNSYYKSLNNEIANARYYFSFTDGQAEWKRRYYEKPLNMKERRIKGIEVQITFMQKQWLKLNGSLDLRQQKERTTGTLMYYQDQFRTPIKASGEWDKQDLQPLVKLECNINTPAQFGPRLAGLYPLQYMNMNLFYLWQQGEQITWKGQDINWRPFQISNLSIRKKMFKNKWFEACAYIDVYNLFNNKNMQHPEGYIYDENGELIDIKGNWSWAGNETYDVPAFRNEFLTYMNSLKIKNGDRPGDYPHDGEKVYIQMPGFTPWTFLEKRDFYLGLEFNFN